MDLESGSTDWPAIQVDGRYFRRLHSDRDWIKRRVESVNFLDLERIERRVSVDIDTERLRSIAVEAGLADSSEYIYAPLAAWSKQIQLDLDFSDRSGTILSLVTSDQDSYASLTMILATVEKHLGEEFARALPPDVIDDIRHIVKDHNQNRLREVVNLRNAYRIRRSIVLTDPNDDNRARIWQELLNSDPIGNLLSQFSEKYQVIVMVPCDGRVATVKYRYVESGPRPKIPVLAKLGLASFDFAIEAPSVGTAQREHLRCLAPEEMSVQDGALEEVTPDRLILDPVPPIPGRRLYRISGERAVFYTRGVPAGQWWAVLRINPNIESFYLPSLGAVGIAFVLLVLAMSYELAIAPIESGEGVNSTVSVVLVVSSLLTIYVSRQGEHAMLRALLALPRILVYGSALLSMVVATFVALRLPVQSVLVYAVLYTGAVLCLLAFTVIRVTVVQEQVAEDSSETWEVYD